MTKPLRSFVIQTLFAICHCGPWRGKYFPGRESPTKPSSSSGQVLSTFFRFFPPFSTSPPLNGARLLFLATPNDSKRRSTRPLFFSPHSEVGNLEEQVRQIIPVALLCTNLQQLPVKPESIQVQVLSGKLSCSARKRVSASQPRGQGANQGTYRPTQPQRQ